MVAVPVLAGFVLRLLRAVALCLCLSNSSTGTQQSEWEYLYVVVGSPRGGRVRNTPKWARLSG